MAYEKGVGMVRKKVAPFAVLVAAASLFIGCGGIDNTDENTVGSNLISGEIIDDINASTMLQVIQSQIPELNATNAFGYKAVKIVYDTTTPDGKTVKASGLLVIPEVSDAYKQYLTQNGKTFSVSSICDNHGTIFKNDEAPSVVEKHNGKPDYSVAVLMSGYAGFATIAPDYLGYGESNNTVHPYIMKSSAQASLDMIKASIRYMQDHGIAYNGQLFVSGYSEGGYVAMNLARDIEQNHSDEFTLKGVAPMAGPYDVEALGDYELNASKKMVVPAFLAEIGWSYSVYYDDVSIDDLMVKASVFRQIDLFGGQYDTVAIQAYLGLADIANGDYGFNTHTANELFKTSFIDDYHNNLNNSVRVHFEENNAYKNWTPEAPVNLIQCQDDEVVPFALSTQKAYMTLSATDANVSMTPIPSSMLPAPTQTSFLVHQRCGNVAYGVAVKWFDAIRQGDTQ